MKKILALAMGLALCLTAAACTNTPKTVVTTPTDTTPAEMEETTVPAETEPVQGLCGGYTLPEFAEVDLGDAQEAFDKAMDGFTGSAVKPLALLATQVVAGTNYAVLCETTVVVPGAAPQLQIACIYKDLEGNATFTGFLPFDLAAIMAAEQPAQAEQPMGGGWTLNADLTATANLTDEAKACYDAYFEGAKPEETGLTDVMTLGTQVVAGTNFAVLTRTVSAEETDPEAFTEPDLLYVTVYYKDLEGKVDRTGTYLVDWREWDFSGYFTAEPEETTAADEPEETTVPEAMEPVIGMVGGYTLPEFTDVDLGDAQEAFDKAFEGFTGSAVKPLALLATQVVAGTNYAVLCETKVVVPNAVPQLQIVSIYKDLEGNASINGFLPFDLAAIMVAEQPAQAEQPMGGGWTLNADLAATANLTDEAKACYDAYFEGSTPEETGLTDVMTLGTQVVAGTSYAVLTRTISTTEDSTEPNLLYVTEYYKDPEGNVDRTGTYLVDWREWDFQ